MAKAGFLKHVQKIYGDTPYYEGDQYGGSNGHDGSGLPKKNLTNFMFATGIECSYPTIQKKSVRRDLMQECGHYDRWKEDLGLVKELGLNVLRYGLPYYSIHQSENKFDWSFADEVMGAMKKMKITPILDLMHFGVPDWVGDYQNPELPILFAKYAKAVAERYPWVRFYTPVNEIYVTAKLSAKDGIWNEQLKSDRAFVTAIKNTVAASILANHQIACVRPDCVIVQSESAEYVHEAYTTKDPAITLQNKSRFLALDLLYAHPPDADMCMYLLDNGMTREEYNWFMAGEPPGYQITGNDYYGRNEHIRMPNGDTMNASDVLGWYLITKDYYNRYKKPLMHTETNTFNPDEAPVWLWKQWLNILRMRDDGVPVLGFTWYSLIDQMDWDISLREKKGTVNACGLYDLDRKPRPVAHAYRELLEQFGQITMVPHGELFQMNHKPASLKVEI